MEGPCRTTPGEHCVAALHPTGSTTLKKFDKKDEESSGGSSPFQHLEKSAILQEARVFNETPINPQKCDHILTKNLYLINRGKHLGTTEATEAFFAVTELRHDWERRQLLRPAVRALCQITDSSMSTMACFMSPLHLLKCSFDVVKCWVNEAQEVASSDNLMVQHQALGLLCHMCKNDCLAVNRMISKVASKQLEEEDGSRDSPLFDLIEHCFCQCSSFSATHPRLLSVTQLFTPSSGSGVPGQRLKSQRRQLAIATLLKTGSESSINHLMKQMSSFLSEISHEFKVVVVQAISALCQKYPHKHGILINFLLTVLQEEGGCEDKRATVDGIISITEENSESKETGLSHLCEFIEGCEFTVLASRLLHLLGQEGPKTTNPQSTSTSSITQWSWSMMRSGQELRVLWASLEPRMKVLPSILALLKRSPGAKQKALNAGYILNGLTVSVSDLERALHQYMLEQSEKPFDLKSVLLTTVPMAERKTESTLITKVAATRTSSRSSWWQCQGSRDLGPS
ncbi:hypothetical protein P7K49_031989 [Saguinus oedipus]|uniref:Clathrin/coatomer adaptor adaptin-like N-terminal domain-containing protein n=1 Tax=Saguinus oedipus TaxID=9490 RepID=A0ABQ9TWZ6_SAGOE|nr:hypothetical protein P7K49_031989 [Saguinus oedipus]